MSQPRLPPDLKRLLHQAGLTASCYQPVTMFVKNGRKLPNVAEPGDPWECFLRRDGQVGIASSATGDTLRDAIESAIISLLEPRGVLEAIKALTLEVEKLTGAIHARQG